MSVPSPSTAPTHRRRLQTLLPVLVQNQKIKKKHQKRNLINQSGVSVNDQSVETETEVPESSTSSYSTRIKNANEISVDELPSPSNTDTMTKETLSSPEGPAFSTRKKQTTKSGSCTCSCDSPNSKILPLREVPIVGSQGEIRYVNVPLTSAEVKEFKKEMKNLLSDPVGLSEQFDQFLDPNIFTWKELHSIMQTQCCGFLLWVYSRID